MKFFENNLAPNELYCPKTMFVLLHFCFVRGRRAVLQILVLEEKIPCFCLIFLCFL